jgi:biotin operon repressor
MNIAEVLASDLDDNLKRLMLALVGSSHEGKTSYATIDRLAVVLGCSERTVQRGLRHLEWGNCIQTTQSGGARMSSEFSLLGCQMAPSRVTGKIVEKQRQSASLPYSNSVQASDVTPREREGRPEAVNRRLIVIRRRQSVRDGFLSLLSIMNDDEYITAPGLAKHLGLTSGVVMRDLLALFRSQDIPRSLHSRLRKSQRKPWHWKKMDSKVVNFCDHHEGAKRNG